MSHKPLKVAAAKKSFPNVYIIDWTCFDECFLFHVITRRHYFLHKFIITQRFGEAAMLLCSLEKIFWKKSAIYIRYLHNNVQCCQGPQPSFYFVDSVFYSFSLWMFHIFYYRQSFWNLKAQKLSRGMFFQSYTQMFIMPICFNNLFPISESKIAM